MIVSYLERYIRYLDSKYEMIILGGDMNGEREKKNWKYLKAENTTWRKTATTKVSRQDIPYCDWRKSNKPNLTERKMISGAQLCPCAGQDTGLYTEI